MGTVIKTQDLQDSFNERMEKRNEKFFNTIRPLINLRNSISNINKSGYVYENLEKVKNNKYFFCDLVRMIQYPSGGGF